MPECEACGGSIDRGERECPYCGHVLIKHSTAADPSKRDTRVFSLDKDSGTIHFGDGKTGAVPESGRVVSHHRPRTGYEPKDTVICPKCGHKNQPVRWECEACAATLRKPKTGLRKT